MIDVKNYDYTYKYLRQIANGYWSIEKILTYGRPLLLITGSRSVGKSTNTSCEVLLEWMLREREWAYVRRDQDELNLTVRSFFDDATPIIGENTGLAAPVIVYKGGKYYALKKMAGGDYTEVLCGHAIPLNNENKVKSAKFPNVNSIIYDEFILKDPTKYLGTIADGNKREWRNLYSLFVTIDRCRGKMHRNNTKIICLGNLATTYNPIFISQDLIKYHNYKARFIAPKDKGFVLEQVDHVDKMDEEDYKHSNAFLLADEEERAYNFENKGADFFEKEFCKRTPQGTRYFAALAVSGKRFCVNKDLKGNYYINTKIPKEAKIFSLDGDSFSENSYQLITRWRDYPVLEILSGAFRKKRLFFENTSVKNALYNFFVLLP